VLSVLASAVQLSPTKKRLVMGQQRRLTFCDFRKSILKGFCNACVKRASRLAKQCAVGCVLYERVLEQVARVRRHTLLEQQACLFTKQSIS
jgi:hypothetical protein